MRSAHKWLAGFLVIVCTFMLSPRPVFADPLKIDLTHVFHTKLMVDAGVQGVWMPREDADFLLNLRTQIPSLVDLVNTKDAEVQATQAQVATYKNIVSLTEQKVAVYEKLNVDLDQALQSRMAHDRSWSSTSSILWLVAGIGLGIGTAVGITWAVHH